MAGTWRPNNFVAEQLQPQTCIPWGRHCYFCCLVGTLTLALPAMCTPVQLDRHLQAALRLAGTAHLNAPIGDICGINTNIESMPVYDSMYDQAVTIQTNGAC